MYSDQKKIYFKPSKMHVNPNFQASKINSVPNQTTHFNPKFYQRVNQDNCISSNQTKKIFINPNYIPRNHVEEAPSKVIGNNMPKLETIKRSRYKLIRNSTPERHCNIQVEKGETFMRTVKRTKYKVVKVPLQNIDVVPQIIPLKKNISNKIKKTTKFPSSVLTITGNKFIVTKNSLRLINSNLKENKPAKSKVISINGKMFIQKTNKLFLRGQIDPHKLKKINIPCPVYCKFGRCIKKEKNRCDLVHNKKYVSICKKFLRGFCYNEKCTLVHKITKNKMPTCHFYLRGTCSNENCQYSHVNVGSDKKVCPDFLRGYCEKGEECLYQHTTKCDFLRNKLLKTHSLQHKRSKVKSAKITKRETKGKNAEQSQTDDVDENSKNSRYFQTETSKEPVTVQTHRKQLGTLPSFIKIV